MAVYEYSCDDCKATFTVSERISQHTEKKPPKCRECGGENTRRVYSSFYAKTSSKS